MKIINTYEMFSEFYDDFIIKCCPDLHDKYINLIDNIIKKSNKNIVTILDATCGTGLLIEKLLKFNYKVEGMDISKDMLTIARKKGYRVNNGDLRSFSLNKKYDMIVSFDSFGHLNTESDLNKVIENLSKHLNKNGILLFDGGTKEKANKMSTQEYNYDSKKTILSFGKIDLVEMVK